MWERRADYPIQATEVSAAAIGGKVYALCGLTSAGSVNRLFIYDPRRDEWSEGAPAPLSEGADHCNVAAAGGKLYLLGAIRIGSAFVDGNTYEYDPARNVWQTVARMPTPRGASGVAAIGSKIHVAGGLAEGRSVAAFEVFDAAAREWSRLPDVPTARDHLTAQAVGGKVYAIAGRAARDLAVNEEYDPAANAWRARAPIPTARGGLGSGTAGGRIQVFGGEGNSGTPESTFRHNEEYDPAADAWRSLAPMPTPRHGLYGATVDDRVFAPSGGPRAGGTFSSVHEAFFPPPAAPPRITALENAASFGSTLAPGTIVSLFGERLSSGEQVAVRTPPPLQMNAVVVKVNGEAAPLFYVGPGQVNFLIPPTASVSGPARVTVANASAESAPLDVPLEVYAPALFSLDQTGRGQGAILIAGTGLIARATRDAYSRPARKGEVVEIYCTGLGPLQNNTTPSRPEVAIGGAAAEVLYSGAAPGLAGVYQVNARAPASSVVGIAVEVALRIGGAVSNTVTMAVLE